MLFVVGIFGGPRDTSPEPGRWVVDEVMHPLGSVSKDSFQRALNEGEEKGYELKKIQFFPYAVWIVWERPNA